MKWVLILVFLPFCAAAQGVKLARYDAFLKKHRIEMEPVALLSSSNATLSVTFSSVASDLFIQLKGSGWGATTIDDGEELVFRFTNDSTVAVKSVALQTFEPGVPQSTYKHQYRIASAGLLALSRFELAGIRKYSFKEASDIAVPKESSTKLQKSAFAFLVELSKAATVKTVLKIEAKDVYSHIGDSVSFCSKVYRSRSASAENRFMVLETQQDFSSPIVHLLIAEEDRSRFGDDLDKALLNKDVCVSGTVALRNNVPSIIVRKKEQITAPSAPTTGLTAPGSATVQSAQPARKN